MDLCFASARQLARLIRARKLSWKLEVFETLFRNKLAEEAKPKDGPQSAPASGRA